MKPVLIVIEEIGAFNYFYPILRKLVSDNIEVHVHLSSILIYNNFDRNLKIFNNIHFINNLYQFDIKKFSCVVSSATGNKAESFAIGAALKAKIPSIQFVDNIYGWKRRITYKITTLFPNIITVINEQCLRLAQFEGIPKNSLRVVGHPAWESIRAIYFRKNKNTLFIGSPINQIYGNKLGYTEKEVWDMSIKASKEYPNLIKNIKYLLHKNQKKPLYIKKKYFINNVKNHSYYGQVIGVFSSYLTESYLQGKKVVSIQPKIKRDDRWIVSNFYDEKKVINYRQLIKNLSLNSKNKSNVRRALNKSVFRFYELIKAYL